MKIILNFLRFFVTIPNPFRIFIQNHTRKPKSTAMNTQEKEELKRKKAIVQFLFNNGDEVGFDEIEEMAENEFETPHGDYLVLTDEEADEKAKEDIEESVWAFNKSFLDGHSEAISEMDEETFSKIREGCERSNKAIMAMINDLEDFKQDAINADGRGHFLNRYDGEEHELSLYGETFFIYQTN